MVRAVAVGPDGSAVAVGAFDGELEANGREVGAAGADDGFAVALSRSGEVRWAVTLAGSAGDELTAVAIGPDGAIAVAGFADGAATLGGSRVEGSGHPAAVVARLDPATGKPSWIRAIESTGYAVADAVGWAGADPVVAGYYGGTLDPDGRALHGAGALDVWVARLGGERGNLGWIHRGGGPGSDAAQAIAVAPDGDVLVAGSFTRWADLSSTHLTSLDESGDPFVARVGADGFEWARSFTSEGTAVARAVAPLGGGRIALAVEFDGLLAAGYQRSESAGATDACVIVLEQTGAVGWTRQLGGPEADTVVGLGWTGDRLVVAGSFTGAMSNLRGQGGRDGYAIGLTPAGAESWRRRVGGTGDEDITAAAAGRGGVILAGRVVDRYSLPGSAGEADGGSDGFVSALATPRSTAAQVAPRGSLSR